MAKIIDRVKKGRNWLLRLNVISPHLASPVGEGLIHQDIDSPSTYRVTCISPTGENERGLKFIGKVTCSFPLGRLGWVLSYRGGTDSIEC